jgi:hypothetical protein
VSATTPHARPRSTCFRAALLLTATGIVLTGCGRATEPVASYRGTGSDAGIPTGVAVGPGDSPPSPARASQPPATTPVQEAVTFPAVTAPPAAPITLAPDELADIDRLLAGMEDHLADAAHDADTPEGDLE